MNQLTPEQITSVKAKGFLRNRGTDLFSGRVVVAGGVYTAEQLTQIAECARLYGNGKVAFTSRLSAEIVGIPFDNIPKACDYLKKLGSGLAFGGTGAKVRPITACKGTTCVFGCCDTQEIAAQLHQRYYIGWDAVKLPHKFKIAVGGCPNSCMKPSLNDLGIEARRKQKEVLFQLYVGGTWGRKTRPGTPLSRLVTDEELFPIVDKLLEWFQQNAPTKERLGATIDRVGMESLEKALFGQ
ncbi:(4Fe-4S)-binding protein [Oscillospiraceae bacterium MB08-C2-2]|nr:(4Fe-4S)-binding protein [Oscillospiraceae bacterium MB08-C2-2]